MRSSDWSSDVCSSDLGSLAPDGAIVKVAGMHRLQFSGPARVFDCEEEAFAAVENREISEGSVIVIRYEAPRAVQACVKCFRRLRLSMVRVSGRRWRSSLTVASRDRKSTRLNSSH